MALSETIVAAAAGLTGAFLGAWSTTRAAATSARRLEVTAARSELATIYELIWAKYGERQSRLSLLRYRLAYLGVVPEDISALFAALTDCQKAIQEMQNAVDTGSIGEEDAGIESRLIDRAVAAADTIALKVR